MASERRVEGAIRSLVKARGMQLECVSEIKHFGCVLDESGIYELVCNRKVTSGRRVAGIIRSLVNARCL